MSEMRDSVRYRSLVTEMLPYEVPIIFSNDQFYKVLSGDICDNIKDIFKKILKGDDFSIPYQYDIIKNDKQKRRISIIHPRLQKTIALFYNNYSVTLMECCADNRASLRRPVRIASLYNHKENEEKAKDTQQKTGIATSASDIEPQEVSHIGSYFDYNKYTLLGEFIDSPEFIRQEERYLKMRRLDISKCFYHIYTHSISWAVKDKQTAKENTRSYSFEDRFDKLMQRTNYNETNGIVVGPEFSRIFAEIILQRIDSEVIEALEKEGYYFNKQYAFRRYVDDYFIFSNKVEDLDKIEYTLREKLEFYKLYINDKKIETSDRPFVTSISLARNEAYKLLKDVDGILYDIKKMEMKTEEEKNNEIYWSYKKLQLLLNNIRLVVVKHEVSFANVSGRLMAKLRRICKKIMDMMERPGNWPEKGKDKIFYILTVTIEQMFYICALDPRIRPIYSIAQLCKLLKDAAGKKGFFSSEQEEIIDYIIMENSLSLLRALRVREGEEFGKRDSVEIFNLLLVGALKIGKTFVENEEVEEILKKFWDGKDSISYFFFITAKFCYLKSKEKFADELKNINERAENRLNRLAEDPEPKKLVCQDTEAFLLFIDFLSSPDIDASKKLEIAKKILSDQELNEETIETFGKKIWFADWRDQHVWNLLEKKDLRPSYAWG